MTPHPMAQYTEPFVALVEGRTEPDDWLAWWAEHEPEVAAVCPRGWLLRLLPRGGGPDDPLWTSRAVATSQAGACYVLERLGVPAERSTRYTEAYEAEFAHWARAERAAAKRRAAELKPLIDGLAVDFPGLARFLRRHRDEIESMLPGASEAELAELSRTVGAPLPAAYLRFLSHTRELIVGDTLRLTADHPFVHTSTTVALPTEGMVCFGEYWLESDGDQVMFDLRAETFDLRSGSSDLRNGMAEDRSGSVEDPPVLYYAHGRRAVEPVAESFTAWVESLPRVLS